MARLGARSGQVAGFVFLCSVLAAPVVQGSGLATPRFGGWTGLTLDSASSLHLNPAALARIDDKRLQVDLAAIYANIRYKRGRRAFYQHEDGFDFALPVPTSDIDPSKTGWTNEVSANEILPAVAVALAIPLTDRVVLGVGVNPAFGAVAEFPDDGPQRYQIQQVVLFAGYLTTALAVEATDWLAIGLGLDVVAATLSLRQVVDLAGTPLLGDTFAKPPINQQNDFSSDAPPAVRELNALSRDTTVDGATAIGLSFKAGVTLTPHKTVRIALAYQHGANLVLEGDGYLDMNHDIFTKDLSAHGMRYPALVRSTIYAGLPLPASLRLGVGWLPSEAFELHLDVGWVGYSAIDSLDITMQSLDLAQPKLGVSDVASYSLPRRWNDTLETCALAVFRLTPGFRLGLRGGYHSPVSPDATMDLMAIDGHRLIAGVLGRWQLEGGLQIGAHIGGHHILERRVVASDYDRGNGIYGLTIIHAGGDIAWRW